MPRYKNTDYWEISASRGKQGRKQWPLDTIEKYKDICLARKIMLKRKGPCAGVIAALEYLYERYPDFKEMNCTQEYIAEEILGISRTSVAHALARRWKNAKRLKREQEHEEIRPEEKENTAGEKQEL